MSNSVDSVGFNPSVIYEWEKAVDPLAPLNTLQRNVVLDLCQEIKGLGPFNNPIQHTEQTSKENVNSCSLSNPPVIESTHDFFNWYARKENEWLDEEDTSYKDYVEYLEKRKAECNELLSQVETSLQDLNNLNEKYQEVSFKTNSLHQVSESLTNDQVKLAGVRDGIIERLGHFKALDRITQALSSPVLSVHSANIESLLNQIDQHIAYLDSQTGWLEAYTYAARYRAALRRAVAQVRGAVAAGLKHAAAQAPSARAGHHARFLAAAHSVRPLVALLETRTAEEYCEALDECRLCYVEERRNLMGPSVESHVASLVAGGAAAGDHCALVRAACAALVHVCADEVDLYHRFFREKTEVFNKYIESLCQSLYDAVRPIVIHMKHLETLAELCSILRLEMLQEHVSNNRESLAAFGSMVEQLLQDVQERLVFRAHMYIQTDIADYNPSPGDLAYPEKLHMMQSIAESLQENSSGLQRSDSMSSLASASSYQTTKMAANLSMGSPADVHGMWYPPVRRTLTCLSRMYRCVDRPVFQGVSQEALSACIGAVSKAASIISSNKTVLDGEMFLIKHLLILREQIAPFQVDFTVKEMSLDFSKMKSVAWELVSMRGAGGRAWLQLVLDGRPEVRERAVDSRKEVDAALRSACEAFIADAARHVAGTRLIEAVASGDALLSNAGAVQLRDAWTSPSELSEIVRESVKTVKANLPTLQASMHLYLASRDTEFILYRPIKNSVIGCYSRLHQLMAAMSFTSEEFALVGCPTPEQAAILLSSASLQYELAPRKYSSSQEPIRKISTNSESSRILEESPTNYSASNKNDSGRSENIDKNSERTEPTKTDVVDNENEPSKIKSSDSLSKTDTEAMGSNEMPPSPNHFKPISDSNPSAPVILDTSQETKQPMAVHPSSQ